MQCEHSERKVNSEAATSQSMSSDKGDERRDDTGSIGGIRVRSETKIALLFPLSLSRSATPSAILQYDDDVEVDDDEVGKYKKALSRLRKRGRD